MAQPGSALAWGARGRRFESFHTDHINQRVTDKKSVTRFDFQFTINHKVKATGFQPVSFSLAASLGFDEQAICEDAAFPTRGA